jgi:glycosyltransferase involved in cell wall biosynthesis
MIRNRSDNTKGSRLLPTVSVIVPCYNYGHFLPECIASILSQEGVNVDVLIIDDASPDNTAEVATQLAKKNSRVKFLKHDVNKGHIVTYNEGIEWASAGYMLILSADDYLLPGALSRSVNLMNAHPEVGFTFGKTIDTYDNGATRQTKTIPNAAIANIVDKTCWSILEIVEFLKLIEHSGSINIIRTPTAVVRTELQKRVGGYRPELPHSGDMEMWLRLAAHASVGVLDAYQAVYRLHGGNMQTQYYKGKYLADLQQREAALDYFFQTCSNVIPNAQHLHRNLLKPLSREAVGKASHAFNDNEIELCKELSELALRMYPEIRRSLPWTLLTCKQLMGFRVSCTLLPAVAWTRQAALRLCGKVGRATM